MRTEDFHYDLPEELIAQSPRPRGQSRLLVLGRHSGNPVVGPFSSLGQRLQPGDTLVLNNTRVTARRLRGTRAGGGECEVLLLRPHGDRAWEALVRPGRRIRVGDTVVVPLRAGGEVALAVCGVTAEGGRVLQAPTGSDRDLLSGEGTTPLPPYIHEALGDEERYQTVYAGPGGSAAAPTAGLHFTAGALAELRHRGVHTVEVTLHVGIDTFRPVRTTEADAHVMHGEEFTIAPEAADAINGAQGRVVAVGTTCVRALESAAEDGVVQAGSRTTRLFIRPGFTFQVVDGLLTNFHLPCSTLLMLVSALAGRERVLAAYRHAVRERMLFYSFGDAMLVV